MFGGAARRALHLYAPFLLSTKGEKKAYKGARIVDAIISTFIPLLFDGHGCAARSGVAFITSVYAME